MQLPLPAHRGRYYGGAWHEPRAGRSATTHDHRQRRRGREFVPGIPTDRATTMGAITRDLATAHRTAAAVQTGYIWVNEVGRHFLGAPFGGVKQSGFGREECFEEMPRFTQEKNVHVRLR